MKKGLKRNKWNQAGFTLVELIVVLVIMGVLTAAIVPVVTGYVSTAKEKVAASDLRMVEDAAMLYLTEKELETGAITVSSLTAQQLVDAGYLSALPDGGQCQVQITVQNGKYEIHATMTENEPAPNASSYQ